MSTYVPIQAITLSSTATSIVFSGIPQTYTDLIVVIDGTVGNNISVRFNSDSGANYSMTRIQGNGSTATSARTTNSTSIIGSYSAGKQVSIWHFQNYSNSVTNKTILNRGSGATDQVEAYVGLWRNTAAVTNIEFITASGNYSSGTTLTLYGIGSGSPKAFGGNEVRTDGTYWYHIFRSSGRFEPVQALSCDYLVVAGGGGGGGVGSTWSSVGGGGAGGLRSTVTATGGGGSLESALSLVANTSYTVTVGAGGTGGAGYNGTGVTSGSNSIFSTITSTGGGYGSSFSVANGGSGGGGYFGQTDPTPSPGGTGTTNQGFAGGNGLARGDSTGNGGGGGGAGAAGANRGTSSGGNGGAGVATSISGSSVTYAGGGGGGGSTTGGTGGSGGGANGGSGNANGANATANTGGGGGGAGGGASGGATNGGNGGSGIVIVRYAV